MSSVAEVGWYLFIYSAPIGNILMMGGVGGGRGWPPRSLGSPPHWTHLLLESSDWSCNSMFTNQKYRIFSHSKLQSCAPISTVCRIYYNNPETLLDRVACELVQNSLRWVQCARDWCRGPWPRILVSRRRIAGPRPGRRGARWCIALCFNVSPNINTPAAGENVLSLLSLPAPPCPSAVSHAHIGYTGPIVHIGVGGGRRGTLAILWQIKWKANVLPMSAWTSFFIFWPKLSAMAN